jgi:F-type H+-transporting ATPase subunit delta
MSRVSNAEQPFDPHRQHVGTVYAKGLVGAAQAAGTTPAVLAELDRLIDDVVVQVPDFERLLGSPRIRLSEKVRILDRLFAPAMNPLLLNFLKVVARHGRTDCLPEIRSAARKCWNELRGRVEVRITAATALDTQARGEVEGHLTRALGRPVELLVTVDPELLGGMVIRIGDTVYDGSLDHQLQRLQADALGRADQLVHASISQFLAAGSQ